MSTETGNYVFTVAENGRLDKTLVSRFPDQSRSRLQNLIRDGFVRVNSAPVQKTGYHLQPGDRVQIEIPPPAPAELTPEEIPLDILFENTDVLVINKPAGMVVHPAAGHASRTLAHAVLGHASKLEGVGGERRSGIVHRLDKETSGVILVAKNDRAHRWLQEQFRLRKVQKIYLALVDGHPPTPQGRVEAPIARDPAHRKKMAVVPAGQGRDAATEYRVIEHFREHDLVEARPLTGRTHQIRLHLAFIGCPVTGDTVYGRRRPSLPIQRHFLHAARLTICLPGENRPHTFAAPLPGDLERILESLRPR